MKKTITLLWLVTLTIVSCTKENKINDTSAPIMLKVQAVDKDGTAVESQIISIR